MRRFKNILVVYDDAVGGDDVFGQGTALARANSAHLTIVKVHRDKYASENQINETLKLLQRIAAGLGHEGLADVTTRVLVGVPFLEIIRQVLRENHDLVIAGAEGGSVLKDVFFGSTATHLMRKCPCPVWIVKPGQPTPYLQILAAVDPWPDKSSDNKLNIKIMDLASSLALAHGAYLHVMHAWDAEGNVRETVQSELPVARRRALLSKCENEHREAVHALLADIPMSQIRHQIHLPQGLPERAIINLVEERNIDLILMGTVNNGLIPGFFIGSAAEAVLNSVRCSVLTIKPDEFISPVLLPDSVAIDRSRDALVFTPKDGQRGSMSDETCPPGRPREF
jgi:universal stress protein E